jgi:hypothetical protein
MANRRPPLPPEFVWILCHHLIPCALIPERTLDSLQLLSSETLHRYRLNDPKPTRKARRRGK